MVWCDKCCVELAKWQIRKKSKVMTQLNFFSFFSQVQISHSSCRNTLYSRCRNQINNGQNCVVFSCLLSTYRVTGMFLKRSEGGRRPTERSVFNFFFAYWLFSGQDFIIRRKPNCFKNSHIQSTAKRFSWGHPIIWCSLGCFSKNEMLSPLDCRLQTLAACPSKYGQVTRFDRLFRTFYDAKAVSCR